jgi:hypothetical protein
MEEKGGKGRKWNSRDAEIIMERRIKIGVK